MYKRQLVTRGQEVKVGDVLVLLAAGEGEELKTLQTQLDEAQYSSQQKLINMGGGSSEVKRAQEKLQEAIAKRDANVISAEEVELAKLRYEAAVDEHQRLSDLLEEAGGYVEGTGGDTLDGLRDAADAAKLDYESNSIRYSKELKFIDQLAACLLYTSRPRAAQLQPAPGRGLPRELPAAHLRRQGRRDRKARIRPRLRGCLLYTSRCV